MKLNHLNLTVPDVRETRAFLETYFGLQGTTNPYTGEAIPPGRGGDFINVLFDDAGMVLTLTRATPGTEVRYPESFHIGFGQPSAEHVNEINARLKADGYEVEPPQRAHGSWTFYFRAPGGFVIEVMA